MSWLFFRSYWLGSECSSEFVGF